MYAKTQKIFRRRFFGPLKVRGPICRVWGDEPDLPRTPQSVHPALAQGHSFSCGDLLKIISSGCAASFIFSQACISLSPSASSARAKADAKNLHGLEIISSHQFLFAILHGSKTTGLSLSKYTYPLVNNRMKKWTHFSHIVLQFCPVLGTFVGVLAF